MAKVKKGVVVFGLLFFLSLWLFNRNDFDRATNLTVEFESVVVRSNKEELDLRSFQEGLWDELIILGPYSNICSYGVEGFEASGPSCNLRLNEMYEYIIFLRKNKIVGRANVERRLVDLSTIDLGTKRVKQVDAVFEYKKSGDWSEVKLKESRQ